MLKKLIFSAFFVSLAGLLSGCSSLFFFPGNCDGKGADVAMSVGAGLIFIPGSSGHQINLWHIPAKGKPKGVVYFLHGNAQSNCSHVPPLGWLPESGYDLYALDYCGYGLSEGSASFDSAVEDVIAGFKFVKEHADKEKLEIAVLGQSIGGALAVKAFADEKAKPKYFILDSVFSGCTRVVRDKLWFLPLINIPISELFSCGGDPLDSIAKLTPSKVLVMHCRSDQVVDVYHAEKLYEAAKPPKSYRTVANCDHIQAMSQQRIRNEVLYELNKILIPPPDETGPQCADGKLSTLANPRCPVSWSVLHRGRTSPAQDGNTAKLIKEGIRRGVPAMEIDLRLSEDREIVLFHNKRTTDDVVSGPRKLMDRQLEELSAMEIQNLKYKNSQEKIALFKDIVKDAADGNTLLFLDIKGRFERIAPIAIRQATRFRASRQLVVQCDDVEQLRLVRKEFPNVATLLRINTAEQLEQVSNNPPEIVQVDEPLIDAAVAMKVKLPIRVLTKSYEPGTSPEATQELFQRGVDLIMTEQ